MSHYNTPLPADILALSRLSLPSPVLSPIAVSSSWSWSEIPIMLDIDGEQQDATDSVNINATSLVLHSCSSPGSVFEASESFATTKPHRVDKAKSVPFEFNLVSSVEKSDDLEQTSNLTLDSLPSANINLEPVALDHDLSALGIPPSSGLPLLPWPEPHDVSVVSEILNLPWQDDGGDPSVDPESRRLALATALASLENRHYVGPSESNSGLEQHAKNFQRHLPTEISWLNSRVIDISIDQEGFRAVMARFKFSGYTSSESHNNELSLRHGIAQFIPTQRQTFLFHYAPLDGLPTLRRIIVDADETHDYVARQAALNLRANGVYFVRGEEALSSQVVHALGVQETCAKGSRLQWKFEYMVDERKVDLSSRGISDGEKILTPLSFSCSPLLLHQLQGKRITLLHVMKKAVAPKLVSEKLEPPSQQPCTMPLAVKMSSDTVIDQGMVSHGSLNVLNGSGAHRQLFSANLKRDGGRLSRRRRASSAGECSRPGSSGQATLSSVSFSGPEKASFRSRDIFSTFHATASMDTRKKNVSVLYAAGVAFTCDFPVKAASSDLCANSNGYTGSPFSLYHL